MHHPGHTDFDTLPLPGAFASVGIQTFGLLLVKGFVRRAGCLLNGEDPSNYPRLLCSDSGEFLDS